LYDYIAKFDRPGLIAALKEQIEERARAEANRRAA
ncbi:response regulator, partial [Bradyrhizobium sp. HKCCYLRH2060]